MKPTLHALWIFVVSLVLAALWTVGFVLSPITSPQQFRRDLRAFTTFAQSLLAPFFETNTRK